MRRTKDITREVSMDSDPEVWRHDFTARAAQATSARPGHETAAEITLDNVPGPAPGGALDPSLVDGETDAEEGLSDDGMQRPGYFGESARIGRFAVLRQLGEGGMGVVYSAYDEELDRRVALKLLRPGRDNSPRNQARMQREARAMAKLSHPNVVQVYEVGRFEEQVFVAMEFVQGKTLGAWMRAQERTWQEILAVLIQAGRGLQAAHEAGVIHADFKPDNVLIDAEERVRVVDFGLSRATEPASSSLRAAASGQAGHSLSAAAASGQANRSLASVTQSTPPPVASSSSSRISVTQATQPEPDFKPRPPRPSELDESGQLRPGEEPRSNARIAGTPAYMAPEQHRHSPADQRSDQFSFCVTLYGALYGKHPFAGGSLLELVINLTDGKMHPPPADTTVPAGVHAVVVRGLSVDPDQRWPSMADLIAALEAASGRDLEFDLSVARRQRLVLAAIIAASILALSVVIIISSPEDDMLPDHPTNVVGSALINLLMFAVIFKFRAALRTNIINRQLTGWLVVSSMAMLANRALALLRDVPMAATMALDLLLLGAISTLAAITIQRWIGWPAALLLGSAVLAALMPGISSLILAIAVVGVFCLALLFWSR